MSKDLPLNPSTLYRGAAALLLVLCVALVAHEIFGEHGWLALRRQRKEAESLQLQIQQLQQANQKLEQQIKALKSDPKAIEKQAREQLKLARPGEVIYTLPEKEPKNAPHSATPTDASPD